jgi:hypothetical protein
MKSLHRPITGPAMAPARKNMDWTGAALSAPWPNSAAICGSAGVTMLALSWKDSTPSSRVEISRAARRPASFVSSGRTTAEAASADGAAAAGVGVFTSNSFVLQAGPALGM